jgi:hypothetical protein
MSDSITERKNLGFGYFFTRLLILFIPVVNLCAAMIWIFSGRTAEDQAFGRAALAAAALHILALCLAGLAGYGALVEFLKRQV